jgi:hypothetical protein
LPRACFTFATALNPPQVAACCPDNVRSAGNRIRHALERAAPRTGRLIYLINRFRTRGIKLPIKQRCPKSRFGNPSLHPILFAGPVRATLAKKIGAVAAGRFTQIIRRAVPSAQVKTCRRRACDRSEANRGECDIPDSPANPTQLSANPAGSHRTRSCDANDTRRPWIYISDIHIIKTNYV